MRKTLLIVFAMALAIGAQAQWIVQSTNFPNQSTGVRTISIASDDVVWVSPYDGTAGSTANYRMYSKTVDGGNTWVYGDITAVPSTCAIAMIHAVDANNAYAVAYPSGSTLTGQGIYRTTDGGATWARQTTAAFTGSSSFSNVVWMDAEGNGFCQGDPLDGYFELYTTTDFGENWTRVPEANIAAPLAGEYGYVGQIESVGSTIWFTTNKGRIYRSTDKGLNWVAFQTPLSDFGSTTMSGNVSFTNDDYGLIVNKDGNLWKTEDGGENWTAITATTKSADIAFVQGTMFVVTTGSKTGDTGSAWSEDGGMTWNVNADDGDQHTEMAFNANHVGWSGGFTGQDGSGGIFKYDGTFLAVEDMDAAQNVTCFPNPTNDFLQVQAEAQIQDVRILNFLGQEVSRVAGTANYMTLDLGQMQSGIYFVEVNTINSKQTVKVVKK